MRRSSTASIPTWRTTWATCSPAPRRWWRNTSAARIPGRALRLRRSDDELIAHGFHAARQMRRQRSTSIQFSNALGEIWKLIARANKYIDETMPWAAGQGRKRSARAWRPSCTTSAKRLRIISILIAPFMPETAPKIQQQIGAIPEDSSPTSRCLQVGLAPADRRGHQRGNPVPAHRRGEGNRRVEQTTPQSRRSPRKKQH